MGVHQASSNTVGGEICLFYKSTGNTNMADITPNLHFLLLPNVKANKIGPGEDVVSAENHTDVGDEDVL